MILVSSVNSDTGEVSPDNFPILNIVPSRYLFGFTGLPFVPNGYLWDFGDGTNSSAPNPEHTYTTHGYHDIRFSIKDNYGSWNSIDGATSHNIALGKLDFEGSPLRGDKPLLVTFGDGSSAPTGSQYTGMQWDFGDTYGATGLNPEPHNYLDYGSYTIGVNVTLDNI